MHPKNFQLEALQKPVIEGQTRNQHWRRLQLARIEELIHNHEHEIFEALDDDLGKPPTEALFEVIAIKQELSLAKKQLSRWMKPRKIQVPISFKPGTATIRLEPLGCILIIGPWNYPFSLTIQPLISALASGNTAVLKPSEHSPRTSNLIAKLIPKYLPQDVVQVFEGDGDIAASLLEKPFDHIFFTGSGSIGQKVMTAAAKNLTPLTLELGGKSPAIILEGADIKITAKRLIWGKGLNAGQTCIAPDHLLVQEKIKEPLLKELKKSISSFYGKEPLKSPHLAKIINKNHFTRLVNLIEGARKNKQIFCGGSFDENQRRISPALINVESHNDPLMKEEIFGPLLPILNIQSLDEAIKDIRKQPHPLALYMFGGTASQQEKLLNTTSSGGVCFNDVVMQAGIPELPFGGVGPSGMGKYHGIAGFETFSHQKSVLERPFWLDLKFRYPPYNLDISILKRLMS